jgi:hypothetical protein
MVTKVGGAGHADAYLDVLPLVGGAAVGTMAAGVGVGMAVGVEVVMVVEDIGEANEWERSVSGGRDRGDRRIKGNQKCENMTTTTTKKKKNERNQEQEQELKEERIVLAHTKFGKLRGV